MSGLVYCGRCGRRMRVGYHAKGAPVYYVCDSGACRTGEPFCQSLAGTHLEALVTEEVLRAIEPARLELHEQAVADLERERQRLDEHWQKRLERARIQADERPGSITPSSRRTAWWPASWSGAGSRHCGSSASLKEQYDRFLAERPRQLTAADRRRIEALAADIPALWHAPSTTIQDRQTIVRCLVERITVADPGTRPSGST